MPIEVGDQIVISGISGRFPESSNVEEFKQNLFEGVEMVTVQPVNPKLKPGLFRLPNCYGKLKDLSSFDAQFFGISPEEAQIMDPGLRILLECTYEAIVDAGYNIEEIKGSRTGVYITTDQTETDKTKSDSKKNKLANKVTLTFELEGISSDIDSSCSGNFEAIETALAAIRSGQCEAAIVGGTNIITQTSVLNRRMNELSPDEKTKVCADGYSRSESVGVILLQKLCDARRCYATILEAMSNSDASKKAVAFSSENILKIFSKVYNKINIDPNQVSYLELYATGIAEEDSEEANAVGEYFCKNRKKPLPISSVKSNMGHAESVSGLCSLIKVILMFESGMIPKTLYYNNNPNVKIPALLDGRLQVVTENTPFDGDIAGINSYKINFEHAVIKKNPKSTAGKDSSANALLPVVYVSGRTKEAVDRLLSLAEKHKDNKEMLTLINLAHRKLIQEHKFRGHAVFGVTTTKRICETPPKKRPIWFLLTGMGSQWLGMGADFMCIESFRTSIEKSVEVLKKHNIDVKQCLFGKDDKMKNDPVALLVAVAAVQIALVDLMRSIGIVPDGIIGHSLGETSCAYVDGLFTAEESLLCAYYRGLALYEAKLPIGSMAVVALPANYVKSICPPTITVACENFASAVTIAGSPKDVDDFIADVVPPNTFSFKVETSNIAFHSEYVKPMVPILRKYLEKLVKGSKKRSSKWISSSVLENEWNSPKGDHSAEYYVNNLTSPVYFEQALKHVPENAITIEIGGTSILKTILSYALGPNAINLSLMNKNDPNNIEFLLSNLGEIYSAGRELNVEALFPKAEFPVSRGTPMINSAIEWDHSTTWTVPSN